MKIECAIIKDLLPLYKENLVSEDTKTFIEEHLADCEDCSRLLKSMGEPVELAAKPGVAPLQNLKKKLQRKRITAIAFAVVIVLAIATTGFAFLTTPQYLPYSESLFTLTEEENGMVVISFNDEVTDCSSYGYFSEDGKTFAHYISAWNTVWDQLLSKQGLQKAVLEPYNGRSMAIYYDMHGVAEDILIYSSEAYGDFGGVSLPRLVLSYYFGLAGIACVILAILWFVFRKKTAIKLWIERVLLFPASYMIAHLAIKGFTSATHSARRDFFFILFVALFIYLACLLGIHLYRIRKESRDI